MMFNPMVNIILIEVKLTLVMDDQLHITRDAWILEKRALLYENHDLLK